MNEIREVFKSKDYTINPFVIKNLFSVDLNLEEFLLILYFINVKKYIDIEDINKKIGLDKEKIMNIFNSLISKNLIELKVEKVNDKIEEIVSLDVFYDKLVLNNKEEEKDKNDIYSDFEREFGRTLSPFEYETINKWIDAKISEEVIRNALKEAVLSGVSNLRYIDKILYEWNKRGIKNKTERTLESTEVFDYNWLEDDE